MTTDYVPNTKTLKGLTELGEHYARDMFAVQGGLSPVFFIVTPPNDEVTAVHPLPYRDKYEKETSTVVMRMMMEVHHVKRYVHVNEAWGLTAKGSLPRDYNPNRDLIRDRPDRFELVTIIAEDYNRSLIHTIKITRDEKGNPSLGPIEKVEFTRSEGRHIGMLRRDA